MEDLREQQELKRLYTHFEQVMMCRYLCVCVCGVCKVFIPQCLLNLFMCVRVHVGSPPCRLACKTQWCFRTSSPAAPVPPAAYTARRRATITYTHTCT